MEDGESLLNWDGDEDSLNSDLISVSLHSSPTPASFVSVYNDKQPSPENGGDEEDNQESLEINEYSDEENPNEAIVPPNADDVPSERMSNFRCGGPSYEYPAPNAIHRDPSEFRTELVEYSRDRRGEWGIYALVVWGKTRGFAVWNGRHREIFV